MPAQAPLLFLFGGGDAADQAVQSAGRTHVKGSTDLGRLLPDSVVRHRLVITPEFFRSADARAFGAYPVIGNLITEAEHNKDILQRLRDLLRGVPGRVVNRPEAVLRSTRDQIADLLSGIPGLIVPTTIRFAGTDAAQSLGGLREDQPLILREAGTHGGKIVGRFESCEQALGAATAGSDYIATSFVDFRSDDGLYRKFRVFFIGAHRILRHMLIFDDWVVHGHARTDFMALRPELIAEERAMFESEAPFAPEVEAVFDAIRDRMPLDFFGLDFAVTKDGEVLLFEANATMSFMPNLFIPGFEYLQRCYKPAQSAFMELLGVR